MVTFMVGNGNFFHLVGKAKFTGYCLFFSFIFFGTFTPTKLNMIVHAQLLQKRILILKNVREKQHSCT
jgi:hypothetical protein